LLELRADQKRILRNRRKAHEPKMYVLELRADQKRILRKRSRAHEPEMYLLELRADRYHLKTSLVYDKEPLERTYQNHRKDSFLLIKTFPSLSY